MGRFATKPTKEWPDLFPSSRYVTRKGSGDDATGGVIYEIKPNNPRQIASGRRQVRNYQVALRPGVNVNLGTGGPGTSGVVAVEGQRYAYSAVEPGVIGYERVGGDGEKVPYGVQQTEKEKGRTEEKVPERGPDWGTVGQVALVAGAAILVVAGIAAIAASGGTATPAVAATAALLFAVNVR